MPLPIAERAVAWFGLAVGIAMSLMKLILGSRPRLLTIYEWIALGVDRHRGHRGRNSSATCRSGP
jgi:hypothetical protein